MDTVFINLCETYDAVERGRCLEILEGYGVGPNFFRLLNRVFLNTPEGICNTTKVMRWHFVRTLKKQEWCGVGSYG